jgi:hypothetical protein
VRKTPQLSAPVNVPHVLLRREQSVAFDSAVQPHIIGVPPPPHVCGALQVAHETVWPQLLTTEPHFAPQV